MLSKLLRYTIYQLKIYSQFGLQKIICLTKSKFKINHFKVFYNIMLNVDRDPLKMASINQVKWLTVEVFIIE